MATIIKNIELFNNCDTIDEARERITDYLNNYCGEVRNGDYDYTECQATQYGHFTLADGTRVRVVIEQYANDKEEGFYHLLVEED